MKTDNERLKVILTNARLVCMSKFQMMQSSHGAANADLVGIGQKMDSVMNNFNDPTIWANPLPFEEAEIMGRMINVDMCPVDDLTGFKKEITEFANYLDKNLIQKANAAKTAVVISDFNAQVLNALTAAQRNTSGRKIYFRNQGIDLDQNQDFLSKQQKQAPVMTEYRRVLNSNEVQATDSDLLVFNSLAGSIKGSDQLAVFFKFYDMLTATMKSKLPAGNPFAV